MSHPGDQVTAPPDQWWPDRSGQDAYVPVRAGFAEEPGELIASGGYAASARNGRPGHAGAGYGPASGRGPARPATADVPRPREGRPGRVSTSLAPGGLAPQQGSGYRVPHPGLPDARAADAAVRPGRSPGGPARGYPPLPGDPAPRYPQREFAAWNEPLTAPVASDAMHAFAPAWPGTGDVADRPGPATGPRPGTGNQVVALAERAAEDLTRLTDEDFAAWTASLAAEQATATQETRAPAVGLATRPARPATAPPPTAPQAGAPAVTAPPAAPPVTAPSADGDAAGVARRTRAAAARSRKTARRKVRTRRRVAIAGLCVPAFAVAVVMALQHLAGSAANVPRSQAAEMASLPRLTSPAPGTWQHIATRSGDPAPLALSQLFPPRFAVGDASYVRTAELGGTRCPRAVFGGKLQAAVRKYGCSQVMRASYLSAGDKVMGTIGVLNLATFADASKTGKVTGSSEFIAQLTAPAGPTHSLTKGTGLEEAEVKGHYLILTWVEFTNHRAPRTRSQRAQLRAFSADLVSQTANVSLTSRMVTGKPQFP